MKLAFALLIVAACADPRDPDTYVARATGPCSVVELDNPTPVDVRTLRATFAGDHASISRGTCDEAGAPWLVATAAHAELTLPDGVAFALDARQSLAVRGDDVVFEAIATHDAVSLATVVHVQMTPVHLDPNAAAVVSDTLAMSPDLDGARYFAFVGHTARYGVGVRIAIHTDALTDRVPVYLPVAFDPSAPPTQSIAPRALPEGGGFYLQCAYYNTSPQPADDLCGFWAYAAVSRASS